MRNPMLDVLSRNQSMNPLIEMVRNSKNPQAMVEHLARTNPQMKSVMDAVKMYGDPKTAFYKMAESKGVDPESILRQLR